MISKILAGCIIAVVSTAWLAVSGESWASDPHITESIEVRDRLLEKFETVGHKYEYDPGASLRGTVVELKPVATRYCTTTQMSRVDRVEIVRRRLDRRTKRTFAFGMVSTVIGAGAVALAIHDVQQDGGGNNTVPVWIGFGAPALMLGGGALLVTTPDLVKARDSRRHIGEVTLRGASERVFCESVDLSGARIAVDSLAGVIGDDGRWSFDLLAVPDLASSPTVTIESDRLPKAVVIALPETVATKASELRDPSAGVGSRRVIAE